VIDGNEMTLLNDKINNIKWTSQHLQAVLIVPEMADIVMHNIYFKKHISTQPISIYRVDRKRKLLYCDRLLKG